MGILGRNLDHEALSKIDWQRQVRDLGEWSDIHGRHYHQLLETADGLVTKGADDEAAVVRLIAAATSMNLQPETPGNLFQPIYRVGDATSPAIEDFDEVDLKCLGLLSQATEDLWLKARFLDVVCTAGQGLGMKFWQWGQFAAHAYLDYCEAHIESENSVQVRKEVQRGVALCWTFGKKDEALQERCWDIVRKGIHHALNQGWIGVYLPFSELVRTRSRELIKEFAPVFEAHAQRFSDDDTTVNPENAQVCYEIAGRLWEREGNIEASRRCECEAAEVLIARSHSSAQAMLRAEWMAEGIAKLRRYHGDRSRIEVLERELESVRRSIEDEMHSHEFTIDLRPLIEHVRKTIVGPTTHDALMQLCYGIASGPVYDSVRERVLKMHEEHPFATMFGETHYNEEGVPVTRSEPFDPNNETHVYQKMIHQLRTSDAVVMTPGIFESIDIVYEKFGISFNEILRYAHASPAIPEGHEESITRGLMAGFNHDWLEVAAYLIPQVEAVVRNVFKINGVRTLSDRGDSTEEEMSLNQLLEHPHAEKALGKNWVLEMRALMTEKSGYNLRNLYAHGLLDDDTVHNHGNYNLWWMMLRLVLFIPWGAEWMQARIKDGDGKGESG